MTPDREPRKYRRARIVLACLAAAALIASCRPVPRAGPTNGRIPGAALVKISDSCYVVREVAGALVTMLRAARMDGIKLAPEVSAYLPPGTPTPPRVESCYRSYAMQEWWRNYYCSIGRCGFAAVPGTSRHGWGRAVDFEDNGAELSFSSGGYLWLEAHAAQYGFHHPAWAEPGGSSPEPWHWEAG